MTTNETNKQKALHFLDLVISGKIDEAYTTYVDMQGKHHNTYFPAGFSTLQKGMRENHAQFPKKQFKVMRVLSDGDLVAVHSHLQFQRDEPGMIVIHLFRFNNEKIVELWDCGQPIQKDSPNQDGAF